MPVTIKYTNGTYVGPVNDNFEPEGQGTFTYTTACKGNNQCAVFKGTWKNGAKGKGRFTYQDGSFVSGSGKDDGDHWKLFGHGEYNHVKKRDHYIGELHADLPHGEGTRTLKGKIYKGTWKHGVLINGDITIPDKVSHPNRMTKRI